MYLVVNLDNKYQGSDFIYVVFCIHVTETLSVLLIYFLKTDVQW